MPQYQKKGDSIMVKNVSDKVERSAVMMRRMEYTAKLKNIKIQKMKISKAKIIQKRLRQFFKYSYLYKVVFVQSVYRAYCIRKVFLTKKKLIIRMVKLFRIRSALSRVYKNSIIRLKKSYKRFDMGCQADIIEPPKVEETQNEKYLDLFTNVKGGGILNGIKNFPRIKTEMGDNEKMIKRLLCKYNKNKNHNNNIVVSETYNLKLNVNEYDDDIDE